MLKVCCRIPADAPREALSFAASGRAMDSALLACSLRSHSDRLQASMSKLLTYCVLRQTQPSTLNGTGNE